MSLFWFWHFRASYSPVCLGLGVRATSCFILIVLVSCVLRSVLRLLSRYVLFLPAVVPFVSTPLITPHCIYCLCFPLSERLFAYPCVSMFLLLQFMFSRKFAFLIFVPFCQTPWINCSPSIKAGVCVWVLSLLHLICCCRSWEKCLKVNSVKLFLSHLEYCKV